MKIRNLALLATIGFSISTSAFASVELHCGEIKRMRTWVNGSDEYGIWIEYIANPASCSGGFYLPQNGNNRDHVYSFLLASKAAKAGVCIQASTSSKIGKRCAINYVMDR